MLDNLTANTLSIEVIKMDDKELIELLWKGKSVDLAPDSYLLPFFDNVISELKLLNYSVVINFFQLVYMNSSTMNSIIFFIKKLLEEKIKAKVIYNRDLKWQALNFSTLDVFVTKDGLFQVEDAHMTWKL
ncbi:MAG TPA: hypothetical protein PK385_11495 [Spirochaetota bacterium]|jgi:hypothetical protein|nr:MAG: hypothetical protein BWX91_01369 [Spirochaetes bacterium ADurb.Bin133]HNZ27932.1 hypothetical protein [Spirochaetota bacterium]HOF01173.1 hypothetical protein [Spirochaetota bacterium]HOS33720.1 hypothetical protein [Spirochaetota bacterium]HOS56666.1 hypothetical protein [Spirochaetota bacterium]